MNDREQVSIPPAIVISAVAFLALGVIPLLAQRGQYERMATVDAHVTIGDSGVDSAANPNRPVYRWPDSEVPRTVERLRDVTAVAIASITYSVEKTITGRAPKSASEILAGISQRQLIPNQWLTTQPGMLKMPNGTVHLRYSSAPLSIEAVSAPNDRADGPAILIRIPDPENTSIGPRYFESLQVDGIVFPRPFAPIPEIIAAGWRPVAFRQVQLPESDRLQLERWASKVPK